MDLEKLIHSMFRKRYERTNSYDEFIPYFKRYIGVEDVEQYDNLLRTIEERCNENKEVTLIFDGNIPMTAELELIDYVYNEMKTMNIYNMESQDINIFEDKEINNRFLQALDYIIPLAIDKEKFFNDNVRNNFITKLIVWTYSYVRNINFKDDITPKCIYYGTIGRHEIYFLIELFFMGFDVIYINPTKEEYFEEIEGSKYSKLEKYLGILPLETFREKASKGRVLNNIETITKQIERDVQEQLFTDTGIFTPWQFRDGYTKSALLDAILEDIYIYWNEPCKLRTGFKVEGKTVKVPCFFYKIDGQYTDLLQYQNLVKYCSQGNNTLFFNSGNIASEALISDAMYQLMFCQLSDGSFDIEEIKKTNIYKFSKYSLDIQNFLLNKFNETILLKDLFVEALDKEELLRFLVLVLNLDENIIRLIDNFDYTAQIPKVVIYLNNEDVLTNGTAMLLGYFHTIGMDIVIFNPSGLYNVNSIIRDSIVKTIRLEQMCYTSNYGKVIALKQNVFSKFLRK